MERSIASRLRNEFAGRAGSVLLVVSLAWLLTIGARIVYPAVMPGIQAEFGFGYTWVGLLVGALWGRMESCNFRGDYLPICGLTDSQ